MSNVYEVKLSTGQSYTVTTEEHHGNHSIERFKSILGDVLKTGAGGTMGGVVSGTILHFAFKGKK